MYGELKYGLVCTNIILNVDVIEAMMLGCQSHSRLDWSGFDVFGHLL